MSEKPPTRYTEEGLSLPERGSGNTGEILKRIEAEPQAREPEKLTIPAQAINWLVMKAFQTAEGDAWLRGFVTAHGEPSWVVGNQWGVRCQEAEMVKVERPPSAGTTNGAIGQMRQP